MTLASPRVIARLAWRNLRARPGQALLVLLAMTLATTTLSMAIAVNKTGDHAWDRVWRASLGSDVTAAAGYDSTAIPADAQSGWAYQQLDGLRSATGVAATAGPWSDLAAQGQIGAATVDLSVQMRDPVPAPIDQPVVTRGTWLKGDDGVVLEDGLAAVLHIGPGDTVTITGQRLTVLGTALATSAPRYRPTHIGYAWVNRHTGGLLRTAGAKFQAAVMPMRLSDPSVAADFAARHTGDAHNPDPAAFLEWNAATTVRDMSHDDLSTLAVALTVIGAILSIFMIAMTTVLVTARVAAHTRQIGALKSVGVTPGQFAGIVLAENMAVALTAAVIGIAAGTQLSPLLAGTEAVLYGAPQAPPITGTTILIIATVSAAMVVAATVRPVILGVRRSTVRSLAMPSRQPRPRRLGRPSRLGALLASAASATRRPVRTGASVLGTALAVALVTVAIALRGSQQRTLALTPRDAANLALLHEIQTILLVATVTLIVLAVVNAAIVTTLAARDSNRTYAIMRAIGATPGQTAGGFVAGQLVAGLLAIMVGIPTGIVVFDSLRKGLEAAHLSTTTVIATCAAAIVVQAVIASVPAVALSRRPIGRQLSYE